MSTREEQETIINFNEAEEVAEIYTASKLVADRLTKSGLKPTKTEKMEGEICSWYFSMPKWAIRVKPGKSAINIGGSKPTSNPIEDPELKKKCRDRFLGKAKAEPTA